MKKIEDCPLINQADGQPTLRNFQDLKQFYLNFSKKSKFQFQFL